MGLRTKIRRYLYARKFKNKNILELNYSGKNIFITGANSGIGLELTHKFLNLNNKVFATYRNNSDVRFFPLLIVSLASFCIFNFTA